MGSITTGHTAPHQTTVYSFGADTSYGAAAITKIIVFKPETGKMSKLTFDLHDLSAVDTQALQIFRT